MKKARCWVILSIVLALMGLDSLAFGQHDSKSSRQTLRGIREIFVLIEPLKPEIDRDGVLTDQLQTETEYKLRLAGIKVCSLQQRTPLTSYIYIYVNTNIVKVKDKYICAYSAHLELIQPIALLRDPSISTNAATWLYGMAGAISELKDLRTATNDLVDRFINAYLSVNPK
jgi:hypothetical protein